MKYPRTFLPLALAALLSACGSHKETGEKIHRAFDNAARLAGKAAYVVIEDTRRAAIATAHAIQEAARQIDRGWQDGKRSTHH
jgi:hypothetical protein